MSLAIALIAHDGKKPDMVAFAMFNRTTLMGWSLVAAESTGRLLEQKVERVLSGVEGGDLQIAALVATGKVDAVIFLVDPFDRHAHEPDIQGLQRVCQVHDVPLATNIATANLVLSAPATVHASPSPSARVDRPAASLGAAAGGEPRRTGWLPRLTYKPRAG